MEQKARAYAEEAIRALGRLDVTGARTSIAQAVDYDHKIDALADIVYLACAEIEAEGEVSTSTWNTLADAVDSPDLWAVVESSRT
ncbi:MAG TPA: hypothetical protein VFO17_04140 [Acidimicrobiia bacterium]|nr:hypothetical protein [Acidimicrobiia bacterium]